MEYEYQYDVDMTADEKVAAFVWREYRSARPRDHLASCPEATLRHIDGSDGGYGCDTGCEYARLTVDIACPHVPEVEWVYGEFGDLSDILAQIP